MAIQSNLTDAQIDYLNDIVLKCSVFRSFEELADRAPNYTPALSIGAATAKLLNEANLQDLKRAYDGEMEARELPCVANIVD